MIPPFSFPYGDGSIECMPRQEGNAVRWYYRINGGPERPGPWGHHTDTQEAVAFTVREVYKRTRDSAEPVRGRALYRLAPNTYKMEPHPSPYAWLQPGQCYEGNPDEGTRTEEGVDVLLYDPQNPSAPPARIESKNLRRVDPEDCRPPAG